LKAKAAKGIIQLPITPGNDSNQSILNNVTTWDAAFHQYSVTICYCLLFLKFRQINMMMMMMKPRRPLGMTCPRGQWSEHSGAMCSRA